MSLPPPPERPFASDNAAGVAPAVLDAIVRANTPSALAYGDDPWTADLIARFRELFDSPVEVLVCWGGTGANVVGLAGLLQPFDAVICTDSAHILVDEAGAPTRFTGSLLLPTPSPDGKLRPDAITARVEWLGQEHHPQPRVVSISQVTELGTVYSLDELAALADTAHAHGMRIHLDGARIANAIAAVGTDLKSMIRDTGIDVMTFGATKNGAMYGEAVIYVDPSLATSARLQRKQAGQLPSKARFISAQILALLENDLWLEHARHANAMAQRLADAARGVEGVTIAQEPEANAVFATLPRACIAPLQEWSFFWDWDREASLVRWMTSFATTDEDIDRFVAGLRAIVAG